MWQPVQLNTGTTGRGALTAMSAADALAIAKTEKTEVTANRVWTFKRAPVWFKRFQFHWNSNAIGLGRRGKTPQAPSLTAFGVRRCPPATRWPPARAQMSTRAENSRKQALCLHFPQLFDIHQVRPKPGLIGRTEGIACG